MGNCGHFVLAGIATPMFDYYSRKPNARESRGVREYNYHRCFTGTANGGQIGYEYRAASQTMLAAESRSVDIT